MLIDIDIPIVPDVYRELSKHQWHNENATELYNKGCNMGKLPEPTNKHTAIPMVAEYTNNQLQCRVYDSDYSVFQWLCNVNDAEEVTPNHFPALFNSGDDTKSKSLNTPICDGTPYETSGYGGYHFACNLLPCQYFLVHELYRQYITGYYRRCPDRWRRRLKDYIRNSCPSLKADTCVYRDTIFFRDSWSLCMAISFATSG